MFKNIFLTLQTKFIEKNKSRQLELNIEFRRVFYQQFSPSRTKIWNCLCSFILKKQDINYSI